MKYKVKSMFLQKPAIRMISLNSAARCFWSAVFKSKFSVDTGIRQRASKIKNPKTAIN
jgi:hypothetical protein